jgi:predicted DNA-binding protein (MmcQ/YjbR family)
MSNPKDAIHKKRNDDTMAKCSALVEPNDNPRLARVNQICFALAETTTECHGSHAAYLVGKKKFAYYLDNHHGDGIVAITCKVAPGDNQLLTQAQPERFYLPAYLASRGWVALRLDGAEIDWEEVRELLHESYRRTAPKRLAAGVCCESEID